MDLRSMPPCLRLFFPIAILALTACDRGPETTATVATSPTWAEYVEKETVRREANRERNDGVNMYYRDGVPDISGWALEDMVPPKLLSKITKICVNDPATKSMIFMTVFPRTNHRGLITSWGTRRQG